MFLSIPRSSIFWFNLRSLYLWFIFFGLMLIRVLYIKMCCVHEILITFWPKNSLYKMIANHIHPVLIWFTLTCETMNCSFTLLIFVFNELTAWNMFQHVWIFLMDHTESKAIIVCVIHGWKDFYILDTKKLWWIISQSKHCRIWAAKFSLLHTKQYLNTESMWRGYEQVKIMSEIQFYNRRMK